ncbi:glycosyltransferase family 2 protein [bacterium]|nr:glycosyltransferase family 2 protein [bacterium]|tara:strand:- start:1762 stop:2649 length:888 start_codon:yes stop_codon:yes gene_type:complete
MAKQQPKTEPSESVISVLLPTRGRRDVLKTSIETLVNKANQPSRLEILFGIDEDDEGLSDYIKDELAPFFNKHSIEARASVFKPLGYENLHIYVNTLAGAATGDWLFFWNDDCLMDTQGWDDVIREHDGEFKLLAPKDNHDGHPYAILPIIPKDWFILMGHLSQNAQNDAWLSHIAYMLDIFERIDFSFTHDRADITGNNDDETFQNRKYMEGNPSDPQDFGHQDMQNARVSSASKIAWYLDKINQGDLTWWNAVKEGTQDPFEKMVWADGVKGAGQLNSVDGENEYPDDTIISL